VVDKDVMTLSLMPFFYIKKELDWHAIAIKINQTKWNKTKRENMDINFNGFESKSGDYA
jgi:hypothetical protein